jgi:hypothetical protein
LKASLQWPLREPGWSPKSSATVADRRNVL